MSGSNALGGNATKQSLIDADRGDSVELEQLKDKLFIQTGEDQYDTFLAFHHYGFNTKLTDSDRKNYS